MKMRSAGVEYNLLLGGEPIMQQVVLLFQSSWIAKLDVEDAVAEKGAMVSGSYGTLGDLLLAQRDMSANLLICEMACLADLDQDQMVDLAGRFEAILVISTEHLIHLPKVAANIVVLQAPYREADMAAALVECGL